ncbi:MAG: cytochrome c [Draconibacterium sp.]|nr:cytochrome c [Draconibacterium sp.]
MKIDIGSSNKRKWLVIIGIIVATLIFNTNSVSAQDGELLFQQCRACHSIGQGKLLGPDLLDVGKRRDAVWMKNFIKSSQTMVKIGDAQAVELFEEYNKLVMIDYNLPDAEINAIIKYIDSFSTEGTDNGEASSSAADSLAAVYLATIDTEGNRVRGKEIFMGERNLKNGGTACISCHHVNTSESIQGGLLAIDLTKSFSRNGGLPGIKGILEFPPYPAMKDAYQHAAITEEESIQLQVFLMHADEDNVISESSLFDLVKQGIIGAMILLVIISLVWFKRKKRSVNYDIIQRQRR